ncbi:phosphatase PAP2 family protein [Patescibacteria group bacterium]|nr:phosphatase PAP2 family protein [Patescibacteria group bacterium]
MDLYLFQQINQFAGRWLWLDTLGIYLAEYFEYVVVFCLLLFLLKLKKYWKMVFQAIISAVLARFIVVELIRWLWSRSRPFVENNVNLLLTHNKASFPSGHAAFFFALSFIVYLHNKKIGILFFIASFLICLARIFTGIHWPTDILAGAFIGILSGWLLYKIFK